MPWFAFGRRCEHSGVELLPTTPNHVSIVRDRFSPTSDSQITACCAVPGIMVSLPVGDRWLVRREDAANASFAEIVHGAPDKVPNHVRMLICRSPVCKNL